MPAIPGIIAAVFMIGLAFASIAMIYFTFVVSARQEAAPETAGEATTTGETAGEATTTEETAGDGTASGGSRPIA